MIKMKSCRSDLFIFQAEGPSLLETSNIIQAFSVAEPFQITGYTKLLHQVAGYLQLFFT